MGRVVVRAEHLARGDDLDGRLLALHDVDLSCRGAQQEFRRQVEGILHISRRVILRRVQRREVVVVGLDLGALIDLEAHGSEDVDQLVLHLGDRMEPSLLNADRGLGDVDLLPLIAHLKLLCADGVLHVLEMLLRPVSQDVDVLSVGCLVLLRNVPHFLHQMSDLPCLVVQERLSELIERFRRRELRCAFPDLLPDRFDLPAQFFQTLHGALLFR